MNLLSNYVLFTRLHINCSAASVCSSKNEQKWQNKAKYANDANKGSLCIIMQIRVHYANKAYLHYLEIPRNETPHSEMLSVPGGLRSFSINVREYLETRRWTTIPYLPGQPCQFFLARRCGFASVAISKWVSLLFFPAPAWAASKTTFLGLCVVSRGEEGRKRPRGENAGSAGR